MFEPYKFTLIDCYKRFMVNHFLCEKDKVKRKDTDTRASLPRHSRRCSSQFIYIHGMCWSISPVRTQNKIFHLHYYIKHLSPYLNSWSRGKKNRIKIIVSTGKYTKWCLKTNSFLNQYVKQWHPIACEDTKQAAFLVKKNAHQYKIPCFDGRHFTCNQGDCISSSFICDGVSDCVDGSDEMHCTDVCSFSKYCFMQCPSTDCQCGVTYYHCSNSDQCIPRAHICDMKSDCIDNSDELGCLYHKVLVLDKTIKSTDCSITNTSLCSVTSSTDCYPTVKWCTYDESSEEDQHLCPHMEQLQFCASYQCPTMFKCPRSYCIPIYRICDGVSHCPGGDDEAECRELSCPGQLRCHVDKLCVHPVNICDGIIHCLVDHDDEQLCLIEACPKSCLCQGSMLSCNSRLPSRWKMSRDFTTINLYDVEVRSEYTFKKLIHLRHIIIAESIFQSNIVSSNLLKGLNDLVHLSLKNNGIVIISKHCFQDLLHLQLIELCGNYLYALLDSTLNHPIQLHHYDLSNLYVRSVAEYTFSGLHNLRILNLSTNFISQINYHTFYGIIELETLDLRYNSIRYIQSQAFHQFNVMEMHILVNVIQHCCYTNHKQRCILQNDLQKNTQICRNTFHSTYLHYIYLICGVYCLTVNMLNTIGLWQTQKNYTQLLMHLHIVFTNSLLSGYIIIQAIASSIFFDDFIYIADTWVRHWLCKASGSIVTIAFCLTKCLMLILRVNQLKVTKYALQRTPVSKRQLLIFVIISWSILLLSEGLQANYRGASLSVNCASFHLDASASVASICIRACLLLGTLCIMTLTSIVQVIMMNHIKHSGAGIRKHQHTRSQTRANNITSNVAVGIIVESSTMLIYIFLVLYRVVFSGHGTLYQSVVLVCLTYASSVHSVVSFTRILKSLLSNNT